MGTVLSVAPSSSGFPVELLQTFNLIFNPTPLLHGCVLTAGRPSLALQVAIEDVEQAVVLSSHIGAGIGCCVLVERLINSHTVPSFLA